LLACAQELGRLAEHQRVLPTLIAELYLNGGDETTALEWLDRGLAAHSPDMAFFPIHPRWQDALKKPNFRRVLEPLHLPSRLGG
jgi:hypothetical protein